MRPGLHVVAPVGAGLRGGRTAIPANSIARQLDEEMAQGTPQFDMVLFLDGQEKTGTAVEAGVDDFRRSWQRPKWHVIEQAATR